MTIKYCAACESRKKQWTGIYLARVLVLQYNVQLQNSNLCLLICIVHNLARVEFLF